MEDGSFEATGEEVFMVTKSSAGFISHHMDDVDHQPSQANHRNLVRFDNSQDIRYRSVIEDLERMAPDAAVAPLSLVPTTCASPNIGSPSIPGRGTHPPAPARSEVNLRWLSDPEFLLPEGSISESGPALASFGADLFATWRGRTEYVFFERNELFWAKISRGKDGTPKRTKAMTLHSNAESQQRPGVAALREKLVAVWKGVNRPELFFSTLDFESFYWTKPVEVPSTNSTGGPALASWDMNGLNRVYAAWEGVGCDKRACLSWYDGKRWKEPLTLDLIQTDATLGLVCHDGKITVSWKALGSGLIMLMSLDHDGKTLEGPWRLDENLTSSLGPALAVIRGTKFATWKQQDSAELGLVSWTETASESSHTQSVSIESDIRTDLAPSLAAWDDCLVLAWKSTDSAKSMRWIYGTVL